MSLILKGIDMPKCSNEDIVVVIRRDKAEVWQTGYKERTVEAIQIPTPHGRIIDEKELKDLYSQMPFKDNEIRFSKNDIYCNLWNNKTILEAED